MTTSDGKVADDGLKTEEGPHTGPEVELPSDLDQSVLADVENTEEGPEPFRPVASVVGAIGFGLIGALVWALITTITDYQLGLIAIVLGILCGVGAKRGGRNIKSQYVGAGTALLSYFFAQILTVIMLITFKPELFMEGDVVDGTEVSAEQLEQAQPPPEGIDVAAAGPDRMRAAEPPVPSEEQMPGFGEMFVGLFLAVVQDTFTSMGVLFLGFAVWEGYRIPRPQ